MKKTIDLLLGKIIKSCEYLIVKYSLPGNHPFFDNDFFPWIKKLEDNIPIMQKEMEQVIARLNDLPNFQDISQEQRTLTSDSKWKIFPFLAYGIKNEELTKECPQTTELLNEIPGIKTAMYSILLPYKHIPAHRGPYRGLLRLHIPLKIPCDAQNCSIKVHNEVRYWEPNKCLIFDDGFIHEVSNNTNEVRVVLFIDFLRPLNFFLQKLNLLIIYIFTNSTFIQSALSQSARWYNEIWKQH